MGADQFASACSAAATSTQVASPSIACSSSASARERRRDADVAVARIVAVRERRTGRGHRDPGILGQLHDPRGESVGGVEADEVAALGVGPGRDVVSAETGLEDLDDLGELRREDRPVLVHQRVHAVDILEEAQVAQLVDLVGSDGPLGEVLEEPRDVGRRAAHERDAGSGERDLGGRGVDHRTVGVTRRGTQAEDVGRLGLLLGQVVHGVGVVPHDPEVGSRGLHRGELGGDSLADDRPARVAVGRDEPHALDRGIRDERAYGVHVGTVVVERDREHLDAVLLAQGEVTVIARNGADELDRPLPWPTAWASRPCPAAARTPACRASARGWRCRRR